MDILHSSTKRIFSFLIDDHSAYNFIKKQKTAEIYDLMVMIMKSGLIIWTCLWSYYRKTGHLNYRFWWLGNIPWGQSTPSQSRRSVSTLIPLSLHHRSTWCRHRHHLPFCWPSGNWRLGLLLISNLCWMLACSSSFCKVGKELRGCFCLNKRRCTFLEEGLEIL